MPELPEVEAVSRRLHKQLGKVEIVSAHILRPRLAHPQPPSHIEANVRQTSVEKIRRRGKHILLNLTNGMTLHFHLGMTGDLYVCDDYRFRPHTTRAWFELADGRALIFDDARVLGHVNLYTAAELEAVIQHLGVEPLSKDFTPEFLRERARRSSVSIKVFLMDQTKIAGLGNIYAAESLFRAGIHPERIAGKLRPARLERLHGAIVNVLEDALQSACTAYMRPGRFREAESFAVQVYGRERQRCVTCNRKVGRIQQGGRSTYFCPGCQT